MKSMEANKSSNYLSYYQTGEANNIITEKAELVLLPRYRSLIIEME